LLLLLLLLFTTTVALLPLLLAEEEEDDEEETLTALAVALTLAVKNIVLFNFLFASREIKSLFKIPLFSVFYSDLTREVKRARAACVCE
jgi:uncharacterized membrane protein YbhN (UPF0104 family)